MKWFVKKEWINSNSNSIVHSKQNEESFLIPNPNPIRPNRQRRRDPLRRWHLPKLLRSPHQKTRWLEGKRWRFEVERKSFFATRATSRLLRWRESKELEWEWSRTIGASVVPFEVRPRIRRSEEIGTLIRLRLKAGSPGGLRRTSSWRKSATFLEVRLKGKFQMFFKT